MEKLKTYIKGDVSLWITCIILLLCSGFIVLSSSSMLAYQNHGGSIFSATKMHLIHIVLGACILGVTSHVKPRVLRLLVWPAYIFTALLLLLAMIKGNSVAGTDTSRWISIFGMTFQPSELAKVTLMLVLAHHSVRYKENMQRFKSSLLPFVAPVLGYLLLVFKSAGSTSLFLLITANILLLVAGMPLKNMLKLAVLYIGLLMLLILAILVIFPESNRVKTWESRVENFLGTKDVVQDDTKIVSDEHFQIEHSKMAILQGSFTGSGPGKSQLKYFLPQSNSDFIFAILVEEYGYFGVAILLICYFAILVRGMFIAIRAIGDFNRLLVFALIFNFTFQALLNMGVALDMLPVTGQTLPLISAGGSSIWTNCLAIGIVLSISQATLDARDKWREEVRLKVEEVLVKARKIANDRQEGFNEEEFRAQEFKKRWKERLSQG